MFKTRAKYLQSLRKADKDKVPEPQMPVDMKITHINANGGV